MDIGASSQKYRSFWRPPLAGLITGLVVSWIAFSTFGWCAYDTDNTEIVQVHFTWWLTGLQFVSSVCFLLIAWQFLKAGDEPGGDPGLFLTGCITVIMAPVISWLMCGLALLIFGVFWNLLFGKNMESLVETMKLVIIDPKSTLLVFSVIVITYTGIGLVWAIIRLPFVRGKNTTTGQEEKNEKTRKTDPRESP